MENYLSMMMCICSIFLRMINTVDAEDERDAIWRYLKENNSNVYRRVRHSVRNMGTNLPLIWTQNRHHRVSCGSEDFQVQLSVKRKACSRRLFCCNVLASRRVAGFFFRLDYVIIGISDAIP